MNARNQRWLVIAHCFNMDGRAASQTVTDKIPYFLKHGIEPVVITAATGSRDTEVEHHQVTSLAPSGFRFELRHIINNKVKSKWLAVLLRGISSIGLFPLYIVERIFVRLDSQWSWSFAAKRKGAQLLRERSFDLIYASGGASSAFVAAYQLSRRFGVPWIAEIHDPMVHDSWARSRMAYRRNRHIENLICTHARAVYWFTNDALSQAHERHPQLGNRGHVIRPGIIPPDFQGARYRRGDKLRFSYFGGLTPERNLAPLGRVLARLFAAKFDLAAKVEVHVYGGGLDDLSREAFADLPEGVLEVHGRLEEDPVTGKSGRQRVLEAMRESDVLVLMHGQGDICKLYLPSKIYEYLWAQRPVLLFSPVPTHWDDIMDSGTHYVVDQSDPAAVDKVLRRLLNDWETGQLADRPISQAHSVEQAVIKIMEIARNISDD